MEITQVAVEEYLRTVYRPDCDYVDGVIEERKAGERDHAWVQGRLAACFWSRFNGTGLVPFPEWRFQVGPTRFRVPDLVLVRGKPDEQILTEAPLLCVEILSPKDAMAGMNARIQEYLEFGVPVVWLIDPNNRRLWIYRRDRMEEAMGDTVELDGTSIKISFSEIFG